MGKMAIIQMEFGESFWSVLRPVQHARGLTATPHTVYDLNALGIEIGAFPRSARCDGKCTAKLTMWPVHSITSCARMQHS